MTEGDNIQSIEYLQIWIEILVADISEWFDMDTDIFVVNTVISAPFTALNVIYSNYKLSNQFFFQFKLPVITPQYNCLGKN